VTRNSTRRSLEDVLDAFSNIFVRYQEVIAIAASGSNIIAMEGWMAMDEPDSANEAHLGSETDDERIAEEDDFNDGKISSISANVIPDARDKYVFPDGCPCIVISGGKSYLPRRHLPEDELCEILLKKIG
jgi:hypothetical protein